jgi:hypothetical protein
VFFVHYWSRAVKGRSDLRQYRSRLAAHAMMRALGGMHPV